MVDIVDAATRSLMMSGIRGKNTKPEIQVRRALFKQGYRYRLHVKNLPGKPDIVLPKYCAIIFVNGCFWHGHSCHLFKMPKTRREFWKTKIEGNRARDLKNLALLRANGWRSLVIWECAIRGKTARPITEVTLRCATWLESTRKNMAIQGSIGRTEKAQKLAGAADRNFRLQARRIS
jgi:DNA mismatch endonuclease (patch repair protein)